MKAAVTDSILTNVRKNCYTFIQNGNEVLPRFFDRNRQKADDFCAWHGSISLFCYRKYQLLVRRFHFDYAGNESDSRSVCYLILWKNQTRETGRKEENI